MGGTFSAGILSVGESKIYYAIPYVVNEYLDKELERGDELGNAMKKIKQQL